MICDIDFLRVKCRGHEVVVIERIGHIHTHTREETDSASPPRRYLEGDTGDGKNPSLPERLSLPPPPPPPRGGGELSSRVCVDVALRGVRVCMCPPAQVGVVRQARPRAPPVVACSTPPGMEARVLGPGGSCLRSAETGLMLEARSERRSRWPEAVWPGNVPPSAACCSRPRPVRSWCCGFSVAE
jgi:hypothetical protein